MNMSDYISNQMEEVSICKEIGAELENLLFIRNDLIDAGYNPEEINELINAITDLLLDEE
jgi:hypothetical protein